MANNKPKAIFELSKMIVGEHGGARGGDGTKCPLCCELFPDRKKPVKTLK